MNFGRAMSMITRSAEVKDLRELKTPEEGGTKKQHDEFEEKLRNHVMISWSGGNDLEWVIKNKKVTTIPRPAKLSDADAKDDIEKGVYQDRIEDYSMRVRMLDQNMEALYSLIKANLSKMMKAKIASMNGYDKAEQNRDSIWLMSAIDDVMVGFEEIKEPFATIDEQMERIMAMKQKPTDSNEDFVKMVRREVKVYEKHNGDFLWGAKAEEELEEGITSAKMMYKMANGGDDLDESEEKEERRTLKAKLKRRILATTIIRKVDKKRYGNLLIKMQNAFLVGNNEYPKDEGEALKLMNNFKQEWSGGRPPESNRPATPRATTRAVSFLQAPQGEIVFVRGTNNSFHPRITCRLCGHNGHYQSHCPFCQDENGNKLTSQEQGPNDANNATGQEVSFSKSFRKIGILLNQLGKSHINPYWILLDSESSDHIFCNGLLLTDIMTTTDGEVLRMYSNGGYLDTNQKGRFGSIITWYNQNSLANILSLAKVTDQFRVTMDTDIENCFVVHVSQQFRMKFVRVAEDLYLYDASSVNMSKLISAFTFLNTVEQNKAMFKARDVRRADQAVTLNRRLNHIAKDKFERIINNNWIRNCPLTVADVKRSHAIYGPPLPPIRGRTRDQESPRVKHLQVMTMPIEVYEDLKEVIVCGDFHYVNGVTVYHTISITIDYRTVSFPLSRSKPNMIREFDQARQRYHARGLRVVEFRADNEFEPIREDILPVRLRCCEVDDHVPEIERSVQTQKNENRTACQGWPYKSFPRVMVRALIKQGNAFLNAFGAAKGSASRLTPRNIVDNLPHVDYHDLKHEIGEYVQLHVAQETTNTMQTRTIGAIVLDPRDITGRYNFMSLETGREVNGRVVAKLPITDAVIARVEELGVEQGQPFRASKMLTYEWRPNKPVSEEADGGENQPGPPTTHINPEPVTIDLPDPGPNPFVTDGETGANEEYGFHPLDHETNAARLNHQDPAQEDPKGHQTQEPTQQALSEKPGANQGAQVEVQGANQGANTDPHLTDEEEEIVFEYDSDGSDAMQENENENDDVYLDGGDDEIEERRRVEKDRRSSHWDVKVDDAHGKGKRVRKQREHFSFLQTKFTDLKKEQKNEFFREAMDEIRTTGKTNLMERYTTGLLFAQMSAKKGIKVYGRAAEEKLIAEFAQQIEYDTFHGVKVEDLTKEQIKGAGNMINLIEEKTNRGHTADNWVLKGRSVFDGSVQKGMYPKEETASPTVSTDSFFITSIIDAIEERKKSVFDVKGAYLHARHKDVVIMRISGPEVDLLCEIQPSFKEFVNTVKGRKTLYVQLDKALYGCVKSALLWYELFSSTLEDLGFVLNPYDLCVANKKIDGSQCTICWYVDDGKISHKKESVIDDVITKIESKFGKMSVKKGDELDFLGMIIKFRKGKLTVSMKRHILKAINDFKDEIVKSAATPAKGYLFDVRSDSPKLDEERAENFHSVVSSLLYVSRRCRLDIQTAIGFLCTRVSCPSEDDWSKLKRVLQYLNGTIDLVLTLGGSDISIMKSWVDVSYGVHDDCKSHTGGCISFGWGVLLTKCQKQKLNVKSSTEGEIVGVSDFLPSMIWARMFIGAQGFELSKNFLYQDNQSAMKIEKNGRKSSGKNTKHMDNRYFWIKDRLESEGIELEYCPTGMMLADFFTKPLQGSLFRKFRDVVLGYKHVDSLRLEEEAPLTQERVGKDGEQKDSISLKVSPSSNRGRRKSYADVLRLGTTA